MKRVKITIPDNLTPAEEAIAIAQQLSTKLLQDNGLKKIGSGYQIKDLQTEIIVNRVSDEKPVKTLDCGVCNTTFETSIGKVLYINYGGNVRKKRYCSEECRDVVHNLCGEGRTSISRGNLKPVARFF